MLDTVKEIDSEKSRTLSKLKGSLARKLNSVGKFEGIHGWLTFLSYYSENKTSTETKFLNYHGEFESYCRFIKSESIPFKQRFLIHGKHWNCGEVRIDEHGEITFFLFDSLPVYLKTRLKEIERTLKDRSVTIYIPNLSLQSDTQNCAIFAIDGWRRLEKIDAYLPKGYNQNLFEYLRLHSTFESSNGDIKVYKSQLPLYLMKLMQSRTLLTHQIPLRAEESQLPFNKRGEMPEEACLPYFSLNSNGEPFRNTRFRDKKDKFINRMRTVLADPTISDEVFMNLIRVNMP